MEKQFLKKVKEFTDTITPDKENGEAIIVLARDGRVTASIDGRLDDPANMLHAIAKNNPSFGELLENVVDNLNAEADDRD